MAEDPVEEHFELQVVRAKPFEIFSRREFPKMVDVVVACAISGNRRAAERIAADPGP